MRWFVEVVAGSHTKPERWVVEAAHWQPALQAARSLRGDPGELTGFSIELLEDGFRAIDPSTLVRYVLRQAPEGTPLSKPAALNGGNHHHAGDLPVAAVSSHATAVAPPTADTHVVPVPHAPAVDSSSDPAAVWSTPSPLTAAAAPMVDPLPPAELLYEREEDPSPASPLTYRESAWLVPGGTSIEATTRLLLGTFEGVKAALAGVKPGKLVNIAVFDHRFQGRPQRPPILTLTWKDWQDHGQGPVVRRAGERGSSLPPPPPASSAAIAVAPASAVPLVVLRPESVVPRPAAPPVREPAQAPEPLHAPEPEVHVIRTEPSVASVAPPPPAAPFTTGDASLASEASVGVATPVSLETPSTFIEPPLGSRRPPAINPPPPVESAQAPITRVELPSTRPVEPLTTVDVDMAWGADMTDAPAQPAPAPAVALPVAPPPEEAPPAVAALPIEPAPEAAPPPVSALPIEPAPQAAPPPVAALPLASSATQPDAASSAPAPLPAEPPPPAPSVPSVPARRLFGDDLIAHLFEAMHELHFVRDPFEGADFVLSLVMNTLPSRVVLVHFYDIDTREFVVVRAAGPGASKLLRSRTSEREPLIAEAMHRRRAVVIGDAATDARAPNGRWKQLDLDVRSLVCAPVEQAGRFLGLLELCNPRDEGAFGEGDGHALTYIGQQFAEFLAARVVILDSDRARN